MELIVSTAHEVLEALPVWSGQFVCRRCGVRGSLERLFSEKLDERCVPHYEGVMSGWRHDERYERVKLDDIDQMAARFVDELAAAGHSVTAATIASGGENDLTDKARRFPLKDQAAGS